ncbi:MAG: BTAD domain-containing putative transcriptional regulator [Caldilineaceae bacterium]
MPSLVLNCLGALDVTLDGTPITAFPTDKIRALLVYLALETAQPHRRERLAALFWPEMPQTTALTNLRLALHRLRDTLEGAQPGLGATLISSTRQTLHLNPSLLSVDVIRMERALTACAEHKHPAATYCEQCQAHLTQAVQLYRGELLSGFGLADAPDFEEWLLLRREALHQQVLVALATLIQGYEQRGEVALAHRYVSHYLALDPYQEEAHRQMMRLLVQRGLRSEALEQYERCRRLLRDELQIEPDLETTALYEQIRAGSYDKVTPTTGRTWQGDKATLATNQAGQNDNDHGSNLTGKEDVTLSPSHPVTLSQSPDWQGAPILSKVYGREAEMAQLRRWLTTTGRTNTARLVAVVGIGGVGKTTLAAAAATDTDFALVIWRSLLNAPLLDELLRGILPALAGQPVLELPSTLDGQLTLLLDRLQQQRTLLILDNLESILQPDAPGEMRPGYEGYAQLLQRWVATPHQSCLLLTSRERPQGLARWEEDTPFVRVLPLEGLAPAAGQAMLNARGLTGTVADARALVERYSGNPLALKLVAQTVQDLFAGDVAAFLAVEAPIFDDIRTVLDQQFQRLSPLEQEILTWLAIEREPITVQTLRADLVDLGSPRALVEALRALQRRSLLAQNGQGFLLQNVVTEYLTDRLVEQVCREVAGEREGGRWGDKEKFTSSPHLPPSPSALNRFALLKATAKDYVRASQRRLIVQPVLDRVAAQVGQAGVVERLDGILAALRGQIRPLPGYAAGNLLNLYLQMEVDLRGYDFSGLPIWQADLQGRRLPGVNLTGADLAHSTFTYVFGDMLALHFTAEGQLLVAAVLQGNLCLWRALDGQLLREYQSFGGSAIIASFSSDGTRLISADTDHQVRIWDTTTGRLLHTLAGHGETPWVVRFSGDGQSAASSGAGGTVYLWDVAAGELRQTLQAHPSAVQGLALSWDGQWVASGHIDGMVCLWHASDGPSPRYQLSGHSGVAAALVFDGSGTILVSGSYDCTVRLWDVQTGQPRAVLRAHTQKIRWLTMSADGYTLASGGHDTFGCLWDVRESAAAHGHLLHTLLDHDYALYHLAFRADSRLLAIASIDQSIYLWDVASGQRQDRLKVYRSEVYALDFSPDGQLLASGGDDCVVQLWEMAALLAEGDRSHPKVAQRFFGHEYSIYTISYSPGGDWVASAGRGPHIYLWRASDGQLVSRLTGHTNDIKSLHFSPDGRRLVSASRDQRLCLWDLSTLGSPRQPPTPPYILLQGHSDQIFACAFSPDGRWIASGGYDRTLCLWDGKRGTLRQRLLGHTHGILSLTFSPDGQTLASSSFDRSFRLWDVASGEQLYASPPQNQSIYRVAFHPSGKWLALAMGDNSLRLWQVSPAQALVTLRGHTGLVCWVAFSPDGCWLASGGADETIKLWDVAVALALAPDEEASATACVQTLRPEGPYEGMQIRRVTGISAAQKAALKALGAVES